MEPSRFIEPPTRESAERGSTLLWSTKLQFR